jgi:hypothetical protein
MNYFVKHAERSIATARDAFLQHAGAPNIPDETICNLLTDLRHLCKERGLDFDRENRIAAFRFQRERRLP